MLPEVTEEMDTAFDKLDVELDYPFAYFLVCLGFFVVLTIEHVVLSCVRKEQKDDVVNESTCRCETVIRNGLPGILQ